MAGADHDRPEHNFTDATTGRPQGQRDAKTDELRMPVAEERLNVEKKATELSEVRLKKTVTEEQQSVPIDLEREEIHVQKRDVEDRPARPGEDVFQEGTIRVPVRGEEASVSKETVVTGEVAVHKHRTTEHQNVRDTVRKEQMVADEDYDQHRSGFQQHFTDRQAQLRGQGGQYANRGWEESEPNYRYGYAAGRDQQYQGREFDEVEAGLRSDYESRYGQRDATGGAHSGADDAWQHLREQIREGWNRARGR